MARIRTIALTTAATLATITTAATIAVAAPVSAPHAAAHVAHGGAISFVIGGDVAHPIVLAHGAISAAGKDDPNHDNYDVLKFAGGSFHIVHPESQAKFVPTVDKKTCYATFTESGKFTLGTGTGAYKGIKGSGTYSAHGYAYVPRTKSGACNLNTAPTHEIFTVMAKGKLS